MGLTYVFMGMVVLYTALAAIIDFRFRRIPNYLTVPAAVLGLLFHALCELPLGITIVDSLAGFAIGFCLLLLPWLLGGGGMGDVKLLAALGAWLGPKMLLIAFAVSIAMSAIAALITLTYAASTMGISAAKGKYLAKNQSERRRRKGPVRVVPFAVPVAMSTWLLLVWQFYSGNMVTGY